eukprot:159407-Pleurochrysis_carterae.AAC.4
MPCLKKDEAWILVPCVVEAEVESEGGPLKPRRRKGALGGRRSPAATGSALQGRARRREAAEAAARICGSLRTDPSPTVSMPADNAGDHSDV